MSRQEIVVSPEHEGKRLDFYLAQLFPEEYSRSQIKKMIEQGKVLVMGREVSAHYSVKAQDKIEFEALEKKDDGTLAEDIPLEIIHEDDDLLLVNKPAGMVAHPAHGNFQGTLVNALLHHTNKLSNVGGPIRPGIVHRLDKDTSGIMIIAKNDRTHAFLAKQFKNQTMERVYRVIVKGVVQHEEGICEEAIGRAFLNRKKIIVKPSGGKEATTFYRVLKRFAKATLLEVRPQTGRTHQIRVHMLHIGHPVIGDAFYGVTSTGINRQSVHAFALGFIHPRDKKKRYFECPIPQDMLDLLTRLESDKSFPV
jgi:23S rRNA pseudouridine1911/1915/1917 synthase